MPSNVDNLNLSVAGPQLSATELKLKRIMDEAIASGNIKKALAIRDLLIPPPKQSVVMAEQPGSSALTSDEENEILSLKSKMVSDYNVSRLRDTYKYEYGNKPPRVSAAAGQPSLEPLDKPSQWDKFRNVLHANGKVQSALSPLFGLQYKHPEDAPRNIAGGVAELTGSPMAGEAVDVAAQLIPGVAAIAAYDNGRIPGALDFIGAMNPLKWTKAEKLLTTIGGAGDLISRWLNSIPKRDNK